MVEWLAGNRIRGTSTERTTTTGFNPVVGVEGGWKELDRTTLGSSANIIDVSSLDNKRYYMVLYDLQRSGSNNMQFNSLVGNTTIDATANYSQRKSIDGGADDTTGEVSLSKVSNTAFDTNLHNVFSVGYIANKSDKEKLFITHVVDSNVDTASNAPKRAEIVSKWSDISNTIDIIRADTAAGGRAFGADSEVVVLGWDPADTHSSNFWEELASVDVTTGATISTGDFTAKKYLMVQYYLKSSTISFDWQFNSSTDTQTSTYSGRHSNNGAGPTATTDYTQINKNVMYENMGFGAHPHSGIMFIVNNAGNEKLVTGHIVSEGTATAGFTPNRAEFAYKWENTTNQINNITMLNNSSVQRFIMKVWGSN